MKGRNELAGIEYLGSPGISAHCRWAVQRLIQFGDRISNVTILTHDGTHSLLLSVGEGNLAAVKSGLSSGYQGEGPSALAEVLSLLSCHGTEIEEIHVDPALLERLDSSALTHADVDRILSSPPLRPQRWPDHISASRGSITSRQSPWSSFPLVMPLALIDPRIADLAKEFDEHPDKSLMTAYRRLEDVVRERTALDEHGAKLFSLAFGRESGFLSWEDAEGAEHQGRVLLFIGAYMAFRNARAHRERKEDHAAQLAEFLLINHLFRLEAEARRQKRTDASAGEVTPTAR